jgi:hypothetical protein
MEETDGPEFVVERIISDKMVKGTRFFLVGWAGFGPEDNTWEPESGLSNARRLVSQYLAEKKAKPDSGRHTPKSPTTPKPPRPTLESRRRLEQEFAAADERIIFVGEPRCPESIERVTSVAIVDTEFLFSVVLRNGETKQLSKAEVRETAPAELLEFIEQLVTLQ